MTDNNDDKEKKRRKMFKKMSKVLASCWQLPDATPFQDDDEEDDSSKKNGGGKRRTTAAVAVVWKGFTLAPIGRKIDEKVYRFGRHGWEDFATDLGKVYNVHIQRYVHCMYACVFASLYTHNICIHGEFERNKECSSFDECGRFLIPFFLSKMRLVCLVSHFFSPTASSKHAPPPLLFHSI
jgi:hypothetical protein